MAQGTPSEDFTSDPDAGPESIDMDEEVVLAIREDFCKVNFPKTEGRDIVSAVVEEVGDYEREELQGALRTRLAHLPEVPQAEINSSLRDTGIVAWTIHDLRPAAVPRTHYFELKYPTPVYHRACRISPRHYQIARQEIDRML